jgi:hypothetical protein
MIKLITPPGMLLTVALLAIYCVYAFLIGSVEKSRILMAAGVVAVVATYGVAMLKPWSRYLVYVLAAGFFAKLGLSIYGGMKSGFFSFQFGAPWEIVRSLTPTLLMAVLSAVCCAIVYHHFRRTRGTQSGMTDD